VTRSRTRAWRPGKRNLRFLARNNTLRRYPSSLQAIIQVIHTTSERAREPRGDEDNVEDEETVAATAGEGGASASSTAALSVVELFYAVKVFSLKGAFDAWLATGEDLWVYKTTRREDMLCVLKHSIHAIFTILSAAAGKPDGSAGFHVRPLTSWSVFMYAVEFGFHKIDFWGEEGDVYLPLVQERADSALRRAAVYMKTGYTFWNCRDANRRAAALSVPHEGVAGRFIGVVHCNRLCPWVEVLLPSPDLRRRCRHRALLVTFRRFGGDTAWCPIETAAYDVEWQVGDLATQLFGSDGLSHG